MDKLLHASLADAVKRARFDRVELIVLGPGGGEPAFDVGFGREPFSIAFARVVDDPDRARIEALLHALPAGSPAHCHIPIFGLRLGDPAHELRISICFDCNNAYAGDELVAFDASSPPARELLELFRALSPRAPTRSSF